MENIDYNDISLSFKDISISTLKNPKVVIANVSGYIKKSGITAVIGASASGKSMLMKALR